MVLRGIVRIGHSHFEHELFAQLHLVYFVKSNVVASKANLPLLADVPSNFPSIVMAEARMNPAIAVPVKALGQESAAQLSERFQSGFQYIRTTHPG